MTEAVTLTDVATKQQEILERRATLLGETIEHPDKSITEIIRGLSVKMKCSDRILWDDWSCQDEWISDVFKINVAYANRLVMFHENLKRLGMMAYRNGDNSNAKVGGLRVAKEANGELMELLYKIGVFDRADTEGIQNVNLVWQLPQPFQNEKEYYEFIKWKELKEKKQHET